MDIPTFDSLRADYELIPLVRTLSADTITPVAAFEAVAGANGEAFLLESVERGENVGRYSFIGHSPRRTMQLSSDDHDAIATLRDELTPLRVYDEESLPPFFGGVVGFFGYGVAKWSEAIPDRHERDAIPDADLLFFDNVIAFDHVRQQLLIIASVFANDPRPSKELLTAATTQLDDAEAKLRDAAVDLRSFGETKPLEFSSNCTRERFVDAVAKAKREIEAGEIFQVVLSQRWETSFPTAEALTLYRALRAVNPSPYMFLLRTSECTLVGASPEMLVRVSGGVAEARPIAGTRPRGKTRGEDERLAEELLADAKENAEHLMLVDLGRNDVGRVAAGGSVEVTSFRRVERYSHVMHLVSDVVGKLRDDKRAIDLFLSCFPAGTVSGAPKIRAMEIIDELEFSRRGPYAGAVAYFGFSGNLDSCIAIRTMVLRDDVVRIQAGAGIVYDSVPATEYDECVNKSAALRRAVEIATAAIAKENPLPAGEVGAKRRVRASSSGTATIDSRSVEGPSPLTPLPPGEGKATSERA